MTMVMASVRMWIVTITPHQYLLYRRCVRDDGDNTTINDVYNANCSCWVPQRLVPALATSMATVFARMYCDDNDPNNNTAQPGDACNDGDPGTTGETIQNCQTAAAAEAFGPTFTCVRVSTGDDDGEERNSGSVSKQQ